MPVELFDPNQELVVGPGDVEDDVDHHTDHNEGKFNLHEAMEMSESFGELSSVLRDYEKLKTDSGSEVATDDVLRLLEQISTAAQERLSEENERALHDLVLRLPDVPGLVDKVLKLLNPGEEE